MRGLAGAVALISVLTFSNAFVPSNNVAFLKNNNVDNQIINTQVRIGNPSFFSMSWTSFAVLQ